MNYLEEQRQKAIKLRDELFKDPGGGIFKKSEREFVLKDPELNIFAGVREDVIAYFNRYKIPFWDSGDEPTGHLLSSQIACVNHLYFVRQREDIATAILQGVDKNVKKALRMDGKDDDSGFVEFEVIGKENYLGEHHHARGANSTSVDAVMLADMKDNSRKIFFIEWKYVEQYKNTTSKAAGDGGKTRIGIYTPLLERVDCPIAKCDIEGLFTEPYYQLMRQTLLAHEMTKAKEHGATDYQHLHIIPEANKDLKDVNTALGKLDGTTLTETWTKSLKSPEKYTVIDPKGFISPAKQCLDTATILKYLKERYWN